MNPFQLKRLKHLVQCCDGQRIPLNSEQRAERSGDVPYWGANSIVGYVDEAIFDEELVLLGEDGAPFFDRDKPKAFRVEGPVWPNNHIHVLRPNDGVDARFIAYALNSMDYSPFIEGSTRDKLTQSAMNEMCFPCPDKNIQSKVANFLDDKTARIDALIAEKVRLSESLRDIEEVTAFDMVTRGLAPDATRTAFVEPWLQEVPGHWGLSKLRHIAYVGNGSTPKRDNEAYWAGGATPWLNSGSVNASRISEASDYVTDVALKECHLHLVRAGSTVVALTGQGKTRGTASLTEFATTINQHLAYVSVFDERMTDEYLWIALTGFYSVFRYISDGEGSTKGGLTCEELNKFRLPIPPPNEQMTIVTAYIDRIRAIDNLRLHADDHISRLREYRSSLISAAVAGQLDIGTFEVAA